MWSNPESAWKGFQPLPYLLDREKVFNLPFVRMKVDGSSFIEDGDTTLGSILRESADRQVRAMDSCFKNNRASQEDAEYVLVSGVTFNCRLLETVRSLRSPGGRVPIEDLDAPRSARSWSLLIKVATVGPSSSVPVQHVRILILRLSGQRYSIWRRGESSREPENGIQKSCLTRFPDSPRRY